MGAYNVHVVGSDYLVGDRLSLLFFSPLYVLLQSLSPNSSITNVVVIETAKGAATGLLWQPEPTKETTRIFIQSILTFPARHVALVALQVDGIGSDTSTAPLSSFMCVVAAGILLRKAEGTFVNFYCSDCRPHPS